MKIDNFVDIHPKRIRTAAELDEIMSKIETYEQKLKCEAGVVIVQNMQLGATYEIVSEGEALSGIANPGKSEQYAKFYPYSYFLSLREKFKKKGQKTYH